MAELTISPEEIRNALDSAVSSYQAGATEREEVGRVSEAADGIARVEGLPNVMANELVVFEDGTQGLALNLDLREVGVVVLGIAAGIVFWVLLAYLVLLAWWARVPQSAESAGKVSPANG